MHSPEHDDSQEKSFTALDVLASRRTVLAAGAAAAGTIGIGKLGVLAQEAPTTPSSGTGMAANACVLTPELTEGPYFLDGDLIRQDITDGRPGAPLRLRILVNDATTCQPLTNAAVDIWHCDSHGYYSGVEANNPGPDVDPAVIEESADLRFLRGIQITDENGLVEFQTIYPGWYMGRTVHIHMKVVEDGVAGKTYDGGQTVHTGQLFFDDAISDRVFQLEPYAGRPNEMRTTNDEDNILGDHDDEPGFLLDLQPVSDDWLTDGFIGTIAISVDPSNVSRESMSGGPVGSGPGGPGGQPPAGGPGGQPPAGGPGGAPGNTAETTTA
jgi:protocatechuate 3,4-dioxygenase beta subunit